MLPISLEKSGQILGDLMRSVYTPRINLRSGKIWMTRFKITRGRSEQYYCWYYKYSIDGGKSLISTLINPSAWSGNQSWQAAVPRRRLALYHIHGFDFFASSDSIGITIESRFLLCMVSQRFQEHPGSQEVTSWRMVLHVDTQFFQNYGGGGYCV